MSANILITHIKQTFRFAHFCFLLVKDEDQEVMASALKIGALPFQKTPPNGKGRYNLGTAFKGYMEYAEAKLAELTMDSLTGLYNRTAGLSIWERDYIRGARSRSTTCLIYCDLDSLKYMNDAHGHEKGDIMIKTVADSILQHVRTSYDYAIRIGGDEFIIVMPETKQSAAVGVKKRLQDHIKALSIELDGNSRPISVSMGLSVLRPASRVKDPIEAFNSLVKRAEAKMYIEKKARKAALTLVEKMKNT
jgi:diguanylate cyclase (GGDEF)-like protein